MDNYEKETPETENKCIRCINKFDFNKCRTCAHRHWKPRKSTARGQSMKKNNVEVDNGSRF